ARSVAAIFKSIVQITDRSGEYMQPSPPHMLEAEDLGRSGVVGHRLQHCRTAGYMPYRLRDGVRRHLRQEPAVAFMLDDLPAELARNDGKAPSLRLELRESKPVRQRRKNEQIRMSVQSRRLAARHNAQPVHILAGRKVRGNFERNGTGEGEFDW